VLVLREVPGSTQTEPPLGVQAPAVQPKPGAQSASTKQVDEHEEPSAQRRLPGQGIGVWVMQLPCASQTLLVTSPPVQAAPQEVVAPGYWQAVEEATPHWPAQAPVPPQAGRLP